MNQIELCSKKCADCIFDSTLNCAIENPEECHFSMHVIQTEES